MFLKMPVQCDGAAEELLAAMRTTKNGFPFYGHCSTANFAPGRHPQYMQDTASCNTDSLAHCSLPSHFGQDVISETSSAITSILDNRL
tara:strand:- start:2673 stop:2936 length:264 start_codon:yes stop_codon:yes gene_type:complete